MSKELPNLQDLVENDVLTNLTSAVHNIHSVIKTIHDTTTKVKTNEDMLAILDNCLNYILLVQEVLTRNVREQELSDAIDTDTENDS